MQKDRKYAFLIEEKLYGLTKNQINAGGTSLKYIGTLYKFLVFRVIKYLQEQYINLTEFGQTQLK